MLELSPKDIRSEIKRLKACIREVEATRIAPADDYWYELLNADWEAARAYGELSGRSAAVREIEALWGEIDHLNDALKGRAPRGVTLN
jgi:hypothetical protein